VLRLDLLHPVISGNKWFKLKYHLKEAIALQKKGIVTFGGAFSNHLVATACACKENGLLSIGIIRGEERTSMNMSVQQMKDNGMQLMFVSREDYKNKEAIVNDKFENYYVVPEGGQSAPGVRGASEILSETDGDFPPIPRFARDHNAISTNYTHIICATGTGTTLAGLVQSGKSAHFIGICVLKINNTDNDIAQFVHSYAGDKKVSMLYDYHFGGYAKKTDELIAFMNALYIEENISTDFVYTGKTFFAAHDLAANNFFAPGSRVLIIHTGGLQGNRSLPAGTLVF
jgi:D-cysteine desulfhydrase